MDRQRSYEVSFTAQADLAKAGASDSILRRLPQYAANVGLGLVGGALGVAVTIGLAILIQLPLPAPTVFAPGIIPLMVGAALAGVLCSGLLRRVGRDSSGSGLQVTLVSSVFASLVQTLLFFA